MLYCSCYSNVLVSIPVEGKRPVLSVPASILSFLIVYSASSTSAVGSQANGIILPMSVPEILTPSVRTALPAPQTVELR